MSKAKVSRWRLYYVPGAPIIRKRNALTVVAELVAKCMRESAKP